MFKTEKIAYIVGIVLGIFFGIFCFPFKSHATQVTIPVTWKAGDTVTDVKLNNINNAFANAINGGLDNTNMSSGYRLLQSVGTLPAAGNQGNVAFQTSDNTLYVDNGATWAGTITPSGTLATGKIPYYNGGWQLLTPGTADYSLISNGTSSLPTYRQVPLATGVTGTLAIANGGTGQTTAQTAVDAILPSQTSNSGKFLTTDGTNSSWGAVPTTFSFVSKTTISAATSSGDIAITNTNYYKVTFHLGNFSGVGVLGILFNNDSSAGAYKYVYNGLKSSSATEQGGSASATSITIAPSIEQASDSYVDGTFYIFPQAGTTRIRIVGELVHSDGATNLLTNVNFSGQWSNSAAATSFRVSSTGGHTMSGDVNLYQIKQN